MFKHFLIVAVFVSCFSMAFSSSAQAVTKEEVLKKYEHAIVKSNQMNMYGYNLRDLTFKLKRVTEILVENRFGVADSMLDDIEKALESIEERGPDHLRRERELAWLETFGDFIQQIAIFIVIALIFLRFRFIKLVIHKFQTNLSLTLKLSAIFSVASFFGAGIGLIRYGQSSWSFVDLQIIFIGLSGLIGGVWVGLATGVINGLLRFLIVPGVSVYSFIPLVIGVITGFLRTLQKQRALNYWEIIAGGLSVGFLHSLFMYVPIYRYIPFSSFLTAVFFLTISEGAIILLFFFMAWQIFKEEKRKETEQELIRTRLQFLQAQINPHFLFNTLNTVAAVCGEERAEKARRLVIQLSTFFRRITKEEGDFVPLKEELEYIDAYLNIEKARFGEKLDIKKDIQLSSGGGQTLVPILALQPIVENAVKHGLSKKPEGGTLQISVVEQDARIVITVGDSGDGMDEETQKKLFKKARREASDASHAGIGLANIWERLTRYYDNRFDIQVKSVPGQGTTVTLTLPRGS